MISTKQSPQSKFHSRRNLVQFYYSMGKCKVIRVLIAEFGRFRMGFLLLHYFAFSKTFWRNLHWILWQGCGWHSDMWSLNYPCLLWDLKHPFEIIVNRYVCRTVTPSILQRYFFLLCEHSHAVGSLAHHCVCSNPIITIICIPWFFENILD